MKYDDLFCVKYKSGGRDINGMDCYGLVLECCKRTGHSLADVVYESDHVSKERLSDYTAGMNVNEISSPKKYCVVQCEYAGDLHIGFMVDNKTVLHMTYSGVRLSSLITLKNVKYFEVINESNSL